MTGEAATTAEEVMPLSLKVFFGYSAGVLLSSLKMCFFFPRILSRTSPFGVSRVRKSSSVDKRSFSLIS